MKQSWNLAQKLEAHPQALEESSSTNTSIRQTLQAPTKAM